MGEHLRDEVFRIVDISVQRTGGSFAYFTRNPRQHKWPLKRFFQRTRADFVRFNYLGEWHSHPSFRPIPSTTDVNTMQALVCDPTVGVNFLVLLVCKLGDDCNFEATATAFRANTQPMSVPLTIENNPEEDSTTMLDRVRRLLGLRPKPGNS